MNGLDREGYRKVLREYEVLVRDAMRLSSNTVGRLCTRDVAYASHIFGSLCLVARAIALLVPGSSFRPKESVELWDHPTIATLTRSLMEHALLLHYFCFDVVEEDEKAFRLLVADYHAASKRLHLLEQTKSPLVEKHGLREEVSALGTELGEHPRFLDLMARKKDLAKDILSGKNFMVIGYREIARRAGISEVYFQTDYAYYSQYVHITPYALSQIDGFRAGEPPALNLMTTTLRASSSFLCFALDLYLRIAPEQAALLSQGVRSSIAFWKDFMANFDSIRS